MSVSTPANTSFPSSKSGPASKSASSHSSIAPNSDATVASVLRVTVSRGSPAGTSKLIHGFTQTQHTLDTFAADNPRVSAGNRNGDVIDLITPMTTGSQAALGYNVHPFGFGTTNFWGHPTAAVVAYQVAHGNWSGSFLTQENPYFYNNSVSNSGTTPIDSHDGTQVTNSTSTNKPQTGGVDARMDTVTILGCVGIMTLCMCPDWMTSNFSTSANYSHFAKFPPLSSLATDWTTLNTHSSGVPTELLNLAAQTSPTSDGRPVQSGDNKRGLYFMDYWRYSIKMLVRRYCLPNSPYILGTSGTVNSGGNTPVTIFQVWNEFGGLDFTSGTVGGNNFGDHSINEQVTSGVINRTNGWDWAQYAWLYGHTYQAIIEGITTKADGTSTGYTKAGLGIKIAGPYIPLRWNYYHPTTGAARSTPSVLDADSTYYNLGHPDQVAIAQWFMMRTGTGNAYPTAPGGITQRGGTVPQWTPYGSGADQGTAQDIPPYDMDLLCFDGLQRRSTDPIGQAVSSLPDNLEPARTASQWKAQLLADTPRYETAYADLAQLAVNCGKPGIGIVQSENYSDVLLNSGSPVAGLESTTGTNHQYYADDAWVCAQTASQWLHMVIGGGSYVLRWQPEGVAFLNKNAITATDLTSYYYPAWTNGGNQQSFWYDGRNLITAGITPQGTAPGNSAFSTTYTPGQGFPLFNALKAFHDFFSTNSDGSPKNFYLPTVSSIIGTVEAIDNGTHIMLINKNPVGLSMSLVNGASVTLLPGLDAYEVRIITV